MVARRNVMIADGTRTRHTGARVLNTERHGDPSRRIALPPPDRRAPCIHRSPLRVSAVKWKRKKLITIVSNTSESDVHA